ncbi:phosphotransferase family protein [Streptococcus merionis]|uniref:phosphotransferase family protein n=1 Tax=Streptococcus merionis TaxID=400065 RepID=UPI0026EC80C8|nr:aminoglycoside phosphotransferase family protein [Streptococcus merionis]
MMSKTKNNFSDKTIRGIVNEHFPQAILDKIERLSSGTFNTVYQLEGSGLPKSPLMLKTGPSSAVALPQHEKFSLRTEIETYRKLQNRQIPVPRIFAHDFSHDLIPHDFFFMEKISGKTWEEYRPRKTKGLLYQLGSYTAEMHQVTSDQFGSITHDSSERFDSWSEAFMTQIDTLLSEAEAQGTRLHVEKIRQQITLRKDLLDEVTTARLVNFDLWSGNVFLEKRKDLEISGLIDFERSFFGDPMASFVSALNLYDDVEKEPDFIKGYNAISPTSLFITEDDRERMWLYTLLFFLRSYVEAERYKGIIRWGQRGLLLVILQFMTKALDCRWKKRLKFRKD